MIKLKLEIRDHLVGSIEKCASWITVLGHEAVTHVLLHNRGIIAEENGMGFP